MLLDRTGTPYPEPPKHVRCIGFHGGTRPLKADEDTVSLGGQRSSDEICNPDRDRPVAV